MALRRRHSERMRRARPRIRARSDRAGLSQNGEGERIPLQFFAHCMEDDGRVVIQELHESGQTTALVASTRLGRLLVLHGARKRSRRRPGGRDQAADWKV